MITQTLHTRSGYRVNIISISGDKFTLCINDGNLYPDEDSRSEGNREWIVPLDKKDLIELGQLIEHICTQS